MRVVSLSLQISDVLVRRLVSITGTEGIGKTAVATAVAHYLAVRQRFPGGVYFVHLKVHTCRPHPSLITVHAAVLASTL